MNTSQQISPISAPYVYNQGYGQFGESAPATKEQMLMYVLKKHEISPDFSVRLQKHLALSKIVFVFDDSGSMNATLSDSPLNTGVCQAQRWDELKTFAGIAVEIASVFNPEGTDVYFLNRPAARNVRTYTDLQPYFQAMPNGFTPITRILVDVLRDNNQQKLGERKLLIVIVTDGEPTDDSGRKDIPAFRNVLQNRPANVFTSIVACTDEQETMEYLNDWDTRIPRLDVVDDYRSELVSIITLFIQPYFRFQFQE